MNMKRVTVTIEVDAATDAEAFYAFEEFMGSNNVNFTVQDLPDLTAPRSVWSGDV